MSAERGLAYWPAKRPTLTTGRRRPWTSTRLICSSTLSRLEMVPDSQSLKFSAQSPPCSRKRLPSWASASCRLSAKISHEVTSGGSLRSSASVDSSASGSGYTGICSAVRERQLSGAQSPGRLTGCRLRSGVLIGNSGCEGEKHGSVAVAALAPAQRGQQAPAGEQDEPGQAPDRHAQAEQGPVHGAAVAGAGQHLAHQVQRAHCLAQERQRWAARRGQVRRQALQPYVAPRNADTD